MLFQTVSELLQDHSCFILLFFIGLLCFSAGLLQQAPSLIPRGVQEKPRIGKHADREADYRTGTGRAPSLIQIRNAEEFRMNTSKDVIHAEESPMQDKQQQEPIKANVGLRQRTTQESSPKLAGLRSLSLGNRRPPRHASGTLQDSNPKRTPEERKNGVQRKASLTGEEVKELADALIARVYRNMWVQKQKSFTRHPHSPATYAAPPSSSQ